MPKFRVCVLETRELVFEIEAADVTEAEDIAKFEDMDKSITDQHHDSTIHWSEEI